MATGESRASAFAALVAQQQEVRDVGALPELGLTKEIASLRLTLLKSLREIDEPFQRAIAEPEGADDLGRVLQRGLGEMGVGG